MNIALVCSSRGGFLRGAERFCLSLATELSALGHNVTLITGNAVPHTAFSPNYKIKTIPEVQNTVLRKLFFDYVNFPAIVRLNTILGELKPDVVHFHTLAGISSSLVWVAAKKVSTFVTFHDMWNVYYDPPPVSPKMDLANSYWKVPLGWCHRHINKTLFKLAKVVSPARWLIQYAQNRGFSNRFMHIPPAVHLSGNTTTYTKQILWVGAITEGKGLAQILPVLVGVGSLFQWDVVIAGDGPLRARLERKYPYANFVGVIDPAIYYQTASLLVVSSLYPETGPLVALEGMAMGLCVIGRNVEGVNEIISHNSDGILYNTTEDLTNQLNALIQDVPKIIRIGNAAIDKINREYDWDTCLSRHLTYYAS